MKALRVGIATAIVLLTFFSTPMLASSEPGRQDSTGQITESAEARIIMARLHEIKAMDKSMLTASEIEDLKREVKVSQKRMNQIRGGTFSSYFSELMNRFTAVMHF